MENFITKDFSNSFNGTSQFQNGGPKHNFAGLENPAFPVSDFHTIATDSIPEDSTANHLIFRRKEEDFSKNNFSNFYSSSGKSSIYLQRFDPAQQPSTVGYSQRRDIPDRYFGQSHTVGRSSAPITFQNISAFSTVPRRPYRRFGLPARNRISRGKQECISFLDIETDKVSSYQYRPGEDVTGAITIIVRKSLELRYVQLVVTGQGCFTRRKSSDGYPHTVRETYLHKEKSVIGAADVNAVLGPGQYKSQFRIKLPKDLPSSLHHEDITSGLTFDVSYTLKVRLCDDVGTALTLQSSTQYYDRVRVFMEKQIYFNVQRGFDLSTIPEAMSPIVHTEQINLACSHQEVAIVTVSIDRTVFLAGDDIRVHLQVSLPNSQSVKSIKCRLQEHILTNIKHEPIICTLSKIVSDDPTHIQRNSTNPSHEQKFSVTIPTRTQLVSPYSLGNSQIKVEYFLAVDLRFTPAGGKLSFKIPVEIGPCAEPIYAEKISSRKAIPLFNRTIRFPCFSTRTLPDSSSTGPANSRSSVIVTTKYTNGFFARCFLCCIGSAD